MSDAATRRRNLRSLKLDARALVDRAGKSYSYWRDLLGNDKKSFGEKAARSIEESLGLPNGWLDQPEPVGATPTPKDDAALAAELTSWKHRASARSIAVIDVLILLAEKNALRDEDWQLFEQLAARFRDR